MFKKHWKRIVLGTVGIVIVLLVIYFLSPVNKTYTQSMQGIYRNGEIMDQVTIHFDGEIRKDNRLWNADMEFVGEISVEFEEHTDLNFRFAKEELLFSNWGIGRYTYTIRPFEEVEDCVWICYWKEEGNQSYLYMTLNENWENYDNSEETYEITSEDWEEIEGGSICAPATDIEEYRKSGNKALGFE